MNDTMSTTKQGKINVSAQDIFPIIKKWLYSEHDIFLRELVANATDAITKRATLSRSLNIELPEGKIQITLDKENKKLILEDNGLGMTQEEVEKYLAQVAFSGATEFIEKLKEQGQQPNADIIGKFGLGFYSAFMVSNKVEVDSLSFQEGATPTKWVCEGNPEYTFHPSDKKEVGTTITLHLNEESLDFLESYKVSETLKKFCSFMPYSIFVQEEKINETSPLWKKSPQETTEQEYKDFYNKLFPFEEEPLFWLHLKIDHPFTLEGILYFPKFNPSKPFQEKTIKLYNKQVFVSDSVKSIVPEFLALLKGVIDSSDIPLNVSRSSLQGDPNVTKISNYVIKKVAEELKKLFKNDRTKFETLWPDIQIFVQYGIISDTKFDEYLRPYCVFKTSQNKFLTLEEYKNAIPAEYQEDFKDIVIYYEKNKENVGLLFPLQERNIPCVEIDEMMGPHFIQHVEFKPLAQEAKLQFQFKSLDFALEKIQKNTTQEVTPQEIELKELFTSSLKAAEQKEELEIEVKGFDLQNVPAYFKEDEQMKRFAHMSKAMGQSASFPIKKTLVVNSKNPLVQKLSQLQETQKDSPLVSDLCHYVADLANLAEEGLKGAEKQAFLERSQRIFSALMT